MWQYYEVRSDPKRRRALAAHSYELASLTDDPAIRLEGSPPSAPRSPSRASSPACALIDPGLLIFDEAGR